MWVDLESALFYHYWIAFSLFLLFYTAGLAFKKSLQSTQSIFNKLLLWTCYDECEYDCMWQTMNAFARRNWTTQQFYGKWPFVRMFGLQEPASVVFSMTNFGTHYAMLKKFRREVRPDSPMYTLWHVFSYICLNAWIWSTVFHARDFPITELFDYTFAYSMVLASFYCMVMRMIHRRSHYLKGIFSLICIVFFVNHFSYLSIGRFDYAYNMKANIVTGESLFYSWFKLRDIKCFIALCFTFKEWPVPQDGSFGASFSVVSDVTSGNASCL